MALTVDRFPVSGKSEGRRAQITFTPALGSTAGAMAWKEMNHHSHQRITFPFPRNYHSSQYQSPTPALKVGSSTQTASLPCLVALLPSPAQKSFLQEGEPANVTNSSAAEKKACLLAHTHTFEYNIKKIT